MQRLSVLTVTVLILGAALVGLTSGTAHATFHLMQIEQVVAGVDGDNSIQAIQLRMRGSFQNLVQNSQLVVRDASGANPIVVSTPASSVPNHGAGVRVLIASAGFAGATSPPAVPDFIMDNLIPGSYLAAGSLTFENSAGTIIYWRLSWGGGGYTGSTLGNVTNDADGEYGPPFAGPVPSADTRALLFQGTATAQSVANSSDYALTSGDAVFTNNAGNSFTVQPVVSATGVPVAGDNLEQNSPNPFNPSTEIAFTVSRGTHATIRVYDVTGRMVASIADESYTAGRHRVVWDGRNIAGNRVGSGVYFYRLTMTGFAETRKMVLLK
jgi:hypothetical protein